MLDTRTRLKYFDAGVAQRQLEALQPRAMFAYALGEKYFPWYERLCHSFSSLHWCNKCVDERQCFLVTNKPFCKSPDW